MRFGYWTAITDSWLRNVDDTFAFDLAAQRQIAQDAERVGFDITLVPELNLSDIKGNEGPVLDAWTLASALVASTEKLEILAAIRPIYHRPVQLAAKQAATQQYLSNGRFSLNIVSGWWAEEARQYGVEFPEHDDRYEFTAEYVHALKALWSQSPTNFDGKHIQIENTYLEPKPNPAPHIFAGGESEAGRASITTYADSYVTHGGTVEELREKIEDMRGRREQAGLEPFANYGMAAFVIVRDTEEEAQAEFERITNVSEGTKGYESYQDFISKSQLNVNVSLEDYSVSNRGLRPKFVGTPEQVAQRILEFEEAGLDLLLLQFGNPAEEIVRFGEQVIPLVNRAKAELNA